MISSHKQATGKNMVERFIVSSMKMDDETWIRHASPWSVWTRLSCLPLLSLAIWSREWIGIWAILPIGLSLLWIFLNPRAFSPPARFDHWPAKATFGERVWLNRMTIPIPPHHERSAFNLLCLTVFGVLIMAYGLFALAPWSTLFGLTVTVLAKIWFCDRMVWLYEEMSRKNPLYASWVKRPGNDNDERCAA